MHRMICLECARNLGLSDRFSRSVLCSINESCFCCGRPGHWAEVYAVLPASTRRLNRSVQAALIFF